MNLSQPRRAFLQKMLLASGIAAMPVLPRSVFAQSEYRGKFFMTLQLDGGVDVTSFCDPKTNVPGEREINRWARTQDVGTAGNLKYAPYARNRIFFDKFHQHIMVINGIDAQTNSHTVGVLHNWSGRNAEGFPSLTALFAAVHGPQLPMAYLNFGGFGAAQGIIGTTRVSNTNQLRNIVLPNQDEWTTENSFVEQADLARIMALHADQQTALVATEGALGGNRVNRRLYLDALLKSDDLASFAEYIPSQDQLQQPRKLTASLGSSLHQQIQLALLAFKAGVSVSADLYEGGFDTHAKHDTDHPLSLGNATDAIDYLLTYATQLGLAHRIVLVVGTDFGRTPFFNASNGKDHWPIGSTLVMEGNASYGNRMVGKTDEGHNALKINPATLQQDDKNGVIIKPAHVHKALRRYLGLEGSAVTQQFAFATTEDFRFFG